MGKITIIRQSSAFILLIGLCLLVPQTHALPYPTNKQLNGTEIAEHALFVLRARLPKNAISKKTNGKVSRLINRRIGRKASVNTFESFINNSDPKQSIKQKQLSIFRSGKLKGTGMLVTHYHDDVRSPLLQIWLPKLRKVRRFSAPQADEFWNGSNLTYGEIFLRTLDDETHTLIEKTQFNQCLSSLKLPKNEQSKHTKDLPNEQCAHKNKSVFKINSKTKLKNWWYDNHISFIDSTSFAVYRTQYYKNDELIKTIDMDWQSVNHPDPRAIFPAYLYSKSVSDNSETLFIIPKDTIQWDTNIKHKFWSESSLRRIKR